MSQAQRFDLEPYRNYLRVIAEAGLDPRLRKVVDASDLVQETLLEAHEAMGRFVGHDFAQRAAWLRRILARNLANVARDQGRQKRDIARQVSLEASLAQSSARLGAWLAAAEPSPSEKAQQEERVLELADHLATLPGDQGKVLALRHALGWSLDEISAHMGLSGAAVAGLLRRGLKALREKL